MRKRDLGHEPRPFLPNMVSGYFYGLHDRRNNSNIMQIYLCSFWHQENQICRRAKVLSRWQKHRVSEK